MIRVLFFLQFAIQAFLLEAQNNLPGTYLFDSPPTAIYAQTINNDTIVCMGVVFKDGDTINYQQGAFVAFIDSCGNLIRIHKYFDPQGRDIYLNLTTKIIQTSGGGYCFVGAVGDKNTLFKTDNEGMMLIAKEYELNLGFDGDFLMTIHEINNSYYSVGYGDNFSPYQDDLFLVKFDQEGDLLDAWRFYTPENCEYFQDAVIKGNNIVIGASQTNACISGGFQKSKTRIFEVDTSGNILWNWVDENSDERRGWCRGLTSTLDGGWIYCGAYSDTFYFSNQYNRLFVTKIDSFRNHEWTQIIGYPDNKYNYFSDISIDSEGNFIVSGQYTVGFQDFPYPQQAICAIVSKITPSGEILWTNIAKAFEDSPSKGLVMFTNNNNFLSSGNIIIGGYLFRHVELIPQNEGWLAKMSPNGEILEGVDPFCGMMSLAEDISIENKILTYPNPADDFLHVQLPENYQFTSLIIYDELGRTIIRKAISDHQGYNITLEIKDLRDGIYVYQLTSKKKLPLVGKFIVKSK